MPTALPPAVRARAQPDQASWVGVKLKALLRSQAARTKEALEAALAQSIDEISGADARAWFSHCGYPPRSKPA
jgi:hypothetical protein